MDTYVQDLVRLFRQAFPKARLISQETEDMGRSMLAYQFVAGLLPDIAFKLAGTEGSLDHLLVKPRFQEAKLRDLAATSSKMAAKEPYTTYPDFPRNKPLEPMMVTLHNYGGERLNIIWQVKIQISPPAGHLVEAVVVQKDTPAKLLLGTDLLPKLGFRFIQADQRRDETDLLQSSLARERQPEQSLQADSRSEDGVVWLIRAREANPSQFKPAQMKFCLPKKSTKFCAKRRPAIKAKGTKMYETVPKLEKTGEHCPAMKVQDYPRRYTDIVRAGTPLQRGGGRGGGGGGGGGDYYNWQIEHTQLSLTYRLLLGPLNRPRSIVQAIIASCP